MNLFGFDRNKELNGDGLWVLTVDGRFPSFLIVEQVLSRIPFWFTSHTVNSVFKFGHVTI